MGKKLAFWGDCNGYGYKIIRILEELGGINVSNYGGNEVTLLYYIDKKNHIKGTYNGHLDKEKYVVMTYHDFIAKYPHQVYDIVYTADNHEEGKIVEIVWDETMGRMMYLVDFENTTSWVFVDDIFSYEAKDNSECGECDTAIKPMKVKSNTVKLVDNKVVNNLDKGKTMNKKLAIKGHSTRGKEVIELLEMLGGHNVCKLNGREQLPHWVADNNYICNKFSKKCKDILLTFTLEEFLEKYPFKVGDKVVYTKFGDNCDDYPVTIESMNWTGTTIEYTFNDCVTCLAKDLKMWNGEPDAVISGIYLNRYDYADEVELNLGDYEIEVRDGKTYAVLKKPKYPTTYAECCEVLMGKTDFSEFSLAPIKYSNTTKFDNSVSYDAPHIELFNNLYKIFICRNAYLKIAGEEIGLDKPWEPDWKNEEQYKYCIYYADGNIQKGTWFIDSFILAFPTEEMRDIFCENFKKEIEQCKELL